MESTPTPRAFYGHDKGLSLLVLHGPIRYGTAVPLRRFLDGALARDRPDTVVIDLKRALFVDSTALGLLARIGRHALAGSGRRAVIVCGKDDVATSLHSVAFDELFAIVEAPPYDVAPALAEIELAEGPTASGAGELGRTILESHQELSGLSQRNREAFRDVITALEEELATTPRRG